jgi:alpha-L-glutamate ligase-like protein
MGSLIERLRRVRSEALGLNRRNQEYFLRFNRPRLVGLVDHKMKTKEVLEAHGLPVPQTYGCYQRLRDLGALLRDVRERTDFVLKPACGVGGEGVVVVVGRRQEAFVKAGGGALEMSDLVAHAADIIAGAFSISQIHDEALLEYRLRPEPRLVPYSPGGIPDVRVVVAHGIPVMAMMRLPTRASDGRANLHVGGVGVGIDLATGRAVHAIWDGRPIAEHPDTQQALRDIQVSHWPEILLLGTRSYEAVPLGYFGIDVVVDEKLGPVILELNARPGLQVQLANHRGLRPILEELERRSPEELTAEKRVSVALDVTRRVAARQSEPGGLDARA